MPERLQRKRTPGSHLPANTVCVDRSNRKYGNRFAVGEWHELVGRPIRDRAEAVELYSLHIGPMGNYELDVAEIRRDLAGKNLACYCPLPAEGEPGICHAAVLLKIANEENANA